MAQLRDFSDEAKINLTYAINRAEEQRGGFLGLGTLWDNMTDWSIDCNIDHYMNNIQGYYNEVMDKHNTTKNQLETIFNNVAAIENGFDAQIKATLERAQTLRASFTKLANMLTPSIADGSISLTLSGDEFRDKLNDVMGDYYENLERQLVSYGDDGSPTYYWDAIDSILNKNAEDITELEYLVLATIYASMDIASTEKFLQALADKIADKEDGWLVAATPQKYTEWEYNADKIAGIQKYVDAMISSGTLQQWIVYKHLSDAEISDLYFSLYPDLIGQDIDIDKQKDDLVVVLDHQRKGLIQQSAFLSIALGLVNQPTAHETENPPFVTTFEIGAMTGEAGAFGPKISLIQEGEDYVMTFCNTKSSTVSQPSVSGIAFSTTTINHLNENSISISEVLSGSAVTNRAADNDEVYYTVKYTFDFTNTAVSNTGGFVGGQITSKMLDQISKNLASQTVGKAGSRMIGLIPVAGDIVSFAIDTGMDYVNEEAQVAQDYKDVFGTLDTIRNTNYCANLQLNAIIVNDGTTSQQVIMSPSIYTLNILENLNKHVKDERVDLSQFGLTYPITMQSALEQPGSIQSFLDDMDDSKRFLVLNKRD